MRKLGSGFPRRRHAVSGRNLEFGAGIWSFQLDLLLG